MLSQASTFADVVNFIIGIINMTIPVLIALALVIFMWGGVRYITKAGGGKGAERDALMWGLIALFVLFSIWGILRILSVTLLGTSTPTGAGPPLDIRPAAQSGS